MKNELVLILDLGGPFKELIARAVRDLSVYAEILPIKDMAKTLEKIKAISPIGMIVTGGKAPAEIDALNIPTIEMNADPASAPPTSAQELSHFVLKTCGAKQDYKIEDYAENQIEQIRRTVGSEKVLLALSGGVDSSVLAALLAKAVPQQLTCIFVDHGFMRLNEGDQVESIFSKFNINFIRVNAAERFVGKLKGVLDPETKRKIIGEEFIRVFEEEAKKLGKIPFLAQGTIYPDIVESGGEHGAVIKSHHNVGGLPEHLDFEQLVEPLSGLFKNEVRALGRQLDLPDYLVNRQPFPGPGLAVRVMGEVTFEKLDTLRLADAIFREEMEQLDKRPSQYFAVLTDTPAVGIKDGQRTYSPVVALRAIETVDFMSAVPVRIPYDMLDRIVARITSEIPQVSRVVYDISPKPTGTVEWQ